eukprot:scaffold179427_cov33-Attheya_sp.AAC.2
MMTLWEMPSAPTDAKTIPRLVYDFMKPVFGAGVVYDAPKKKMQRQFQSLAGGLRVSLLRVSLV